MTTRVRVAVSVGLALWTIVGLAKFPLSPGAAFNGNVLSGTTTLFVLAGVTTTLAFRGLSRIELDMMKSLVSATSAEIKSQNSYVGKSPIGAIYSMNLTNMSIAGRMNIAGTSRYVSKRMKTRWVTAASAAAATGYLAYVLSRAPGPTVKGIDTLPAALLAALGLTFLAFFLSNSAITNERLWLSLTSLSAPTYFKHLIASKVVSLMLILSPFAVADAVLASLGYGAALTALVVTLAVIPGSFVLEICWSAFIAPIQVKGDDTVLTAQFTLRQMAVALPLVPVFLIVSASSISFTVAVVGGLAFIGISALLTTSGGFWSRVVTKLTEEGFV
jgi:hypothetical protein